MLTHIYKYTCMHKRKNAYTDIHAKTYPTQAFAPMQTRIHTCNAPTHRHARTTVHIYLRTCMIPHMFASAHKQ